VDDVPLEVVGPEGAALAPGLVLGGEHKVVDDELTAAVEEVGQRPAAARRLEHVLLVDPLPWKLAPLAVQIIPQAGELLLLREQLLARLEPLLVPDYLVLGQGFSSARRWIRRRRLREGRESTQRPLNHKGAL
jgi:hypothetical protein